MRPVDFDIDKCIDDLRGSCQEIRDVLPDEMSEDELTGAELSKIDQEIFKCECCGWWEEIYNMSDKDQECIDCQED
jgi:hypothetical protein